MNYLLDTHTLLWNLISTKKLSTQVKKIISNPQSSIFISTVSLWEISLKYRIGKLELEGKNPEEIPGAIKSLGFNILNLDEDTAATFYKFPVSKNQDPFDLMLAWQAIRKDLLLLTKDPDFAGCRKHDLKIIW
ncbi:MAG: hypothetical protein A3F31_02590 [Candidatus Levybacteria bacterium RIFCSPHIGHO2_12_FULL_38_12]|nr:MAG: hypothetical protein A2770_04995 [Candidatus Levybacteria bacterium RIFCSPHIGHO2_01_FULL_38_12]OGH22280.1 MAG: hypothetical protein A3F31_02590 [Candidatus Levybacteria bacterium RIFCSPHIGHO2_12_FULL_38_12]OGH44220.1 MAG: hypothetical protein A3J14_01555 [Candidatus Levybacteria bacterium RIFCSPLOWO2_02_FULL_37_18]OGH51450.1 MAG: hypothetical protein A3G13_02540 [Candidatus Levybacteria bacterium RIFCSPLOWO2_12_FULL_37_7]